MGTLDIQGIARAQVEHARDFAQHAVLAADLRTQPVLVDRLAGKPDRDPLELPDEEGDRGGPLLLRPEGGDGVDRLNFVAVTFGQVEHRGDRLAAGAEMQDALDLPVAAQVEAADHRLDHRAELAWHLEMVLGDR